MEDGAHMLQQVTQDNDAASTTVFNNEEPCPPRRLHFDNRLAFTQLPPFTCKNSTSARCPNSPMCVMACGDSIKCCIGSRVHARKIIIHDVLFACMR